MHLLVVDDDPNILEILETFIHSVTDHTVMTASSVENALKLLEQPEATPIDCFLLDIQMPEKSGIDLCRILRDMPDHKYTPILMLTAMSDKTYIDQAFFAGASDYITKPFDIVQLRGRIGLIDTIVTGRKKQLEVSSLVDSDLVFGARTKPLALREPFSIHDVDGVIDYFALENYVSALSRKELFVSAVLAFSIRGIEDLYENASQSEYEHLITGVSEAVASCLDRHQFLVSYAGSGVFVCIVEGDWQAEPKKLMDRVNLTLNLMELSYDGGKPMYVQVSLGKIIRLVWKSNDSAIAAMKAAFDSAEKESRHYARDLDYTTNDQQRA